MKTFEHFYPCIPPKTTAQAHKKIFRAGNGRMFLGKDRKGRATENELISIFLTKRPPKDFPRDKPCKVELKFIFPYRKSEKKKLVRERVFVPNSSRPDVDNLAKSACDILTRCHFWEDDGLIYSLTLEKWYHAEPGISLVISVEEEQVSDSTNNLNLR